MRNRSSSPLIVLVTCAALAACGCARHQASLPVYVDAAQSRDVAEAVDGAVINSGVPSATAGQVLPVFVPQLAMSSAHWGPATGSDAEYVVEIVFKGQVVRVWQLARDANGLQVDLGDTPYLQPSALRSARSRLTAVVGPRASWRLLRAFNADSYWLAASNGSTETAVCVEVDGPVPPGLASVGAMTDATSLLRRAVEARVP
jgi:hypothetical protein